MNVKKIVAVLLIAVFALSALCSCQTQTEVKIKLVIEAGDDRIINKSISVIDSDGKGISVIDVVNEAIATYQIDVTLNASCTSVKDIGIYTEGEHNGYDVYWTYTINDETPDKGKAADNYVVEGDVIRYYLVYTEVIEGTDQTKTVEYTSDLEIFDSVSEEEPEDEADE